jgi:hypothetical protein
MTVGLPGSQPGGSACGKGKKSKEVSPGSGGKAEEVQVELVATAPARLTRITDEEKRNKGIVSIVIQVVMQVSCPVEH